ncbi:hypothetical protein GCM10009715_36880 [Paeniglutamicibacter psychrophenolicus]|uniref:ABC transporter permease n=1 Tax=Paeniglutamicibacter psychrophenolicus TaxID=257454 RepID=A0ABS4W891_9MICC|nr:hypothetical protein [Paeniglutamicibacter psychrophenolicus]MBP2372425.1 hypothetical protein [Paeniglutamicibacter psychrophenolicus]
MSTATFSASSKIVGAFSAEMRKARSFPAIPRTLLFGVIALLVAAVFVMSQAGQFLAQGRGEELGGLTTADVVLILLHYGQIIPILLGAWVVGQDIPVGPRQTAFLATPRRGTLFAVKLATTAVVALFAGIVCVLASLAPLAVAGGDSTDIISLAPYWWLIGYWVAIAVVTASLVAATRSITFTVVPILVWTIGLSDLLAAQIPALSGALDQAFKYAYLQGGAVPPTTALIASAIQVAAALVLGVVLYVRRDVR